MKRAFIGLAIKQILHRPLGAVLTILLIALGVALISLLLNAHQGYKERMERSIKGIDMVVGAKGSPLQLVLSSVYHADVPTGNIESKELEKLRRNPLVKNVIPLAIGDSYEGVRIVGTDSLFLRLYGATLLKGDVWNTTMEAVLGNNVNSNDLLDIGDEFSGSHGLSEGGDHHHDHPIRVVGVFNRTGTVVDDLILTSVESVQDVHHSIEGADSEITSILVKFRNPLGLMQLPRMINENTDMQAAVPRYELERLQKVFGAGAKALNGLGLLIMIVAGLSMFIGMLNGLRERIPELKLLRSYGATPAQLLTMLGTEGFLLALAGTGIGLALSKVTLAVLGNTWQPARSFISTSKGLMLEEVWILLFCILGGILMAILPAIRIVRNDIDSIRDD